MLYIIATPIGNLEDFSFRAKRILEECSFILAEDTRKARILLSHYDIKKKLFSFHQFNEKQKETTIISRLQQGDSCALVSDAGMPCLCDPGESLVRACRHSHIPVTVVPGPSAITNALALGGEMTTPFQFAGFLHKKLSSREQQIDKSLTYPGTTLFFDTPHQILASLNLFAKLDPDHAIVVLREMTKLFEEYLKDTPHQLIQHFSTHTPKGEFVLLVPPKIQKEKETPVLTDRKTYALLKKEGLAESRAAKITARIFGKKKKAYYSSVDPKKGF